MYMQTCMFTCMYMHVCTCHTCTCKCIMHTHRLVDEDIFYTPAKTPPKRKQWMDELLDDDKDLFGDVKADRDGSSEAAIPGEEKEEGSKKVKSSGEGLFDDFPLDDKDESQPKDQAANVNGNKGMLVSWKFHSQQVGGEGEERKIYTCRRIDIIKIKSGYNVASH